MICGDFINDTLPEHLSSPPILVGFGFLDFSFMCMICRSLFVLLSFFLLAIVSFDLLLLIKSLVSSNSSYKHKKDHTLTKVKNTI
jgi:hypothetical protein